jgi:D-alanyl-D-alanine carboxypeptidase/D-alanyl-D-alanine-endopeptidase (penicillin-binding protein 4)
MTQCARPSAGVPSRRTAASAFRAPRRAAGRLSALAAGLVLAACATAEPQPQAQQGPQAQPGPQAQAQLPLPPVKPPAPVARAAADVPGGRELDALPEPAERADRPEPRVRPARMGPPLTGEDMQAARDLIRAHGFQPQDVGFLVTDGEGRELAAHNALQAFIPASVAKLPTAVAALELLGGDHRFTTRFQASGVPGAGRLAGDLWLVGGGDPLLGADGLVHLCRELHDAGVRSVAGDFRYDATRYQERRAIRDDQPMTAGYNPGVSALSVNFNRLRVRWGTGAPSDPRAWTLPPVASVDLSLQRRQPRGRESGAWLPRPDGAGWQLSTGARGYGEDWLPLKNPARVAAEATRQVCRRMGVELPAPEPGQAPADARTLAEHPGPPLPETVRAMLRYSNNLVAELTGLAAGRQLTGQRVGLSQSATALAQWFERTLPETDWARFDPGNHSGLNAHARMAPAHLTAILRFAHDARYGRDGRTLMELMPTAGLDGGLRRRLQTPDTAFAVFAKTGTMNFASGLAGYLPTVDGRVRMFAIFVNDKALRRAYDANPSRGTWGRQAGSWRGRAKQLEAALVRLWTDPRPTRRGVPTAMLQRSE